MQHCHFMLVLWALIVPSTIHICSGCILEEKRALLHFKASVNKGQNAESILPTWIDYQEGGYYDHPYSTTDCCNWDRVRCSNTTGKIIELNLGDFRENTFQEFEDGDDPVWFLNISIFLPLKNLQALNLSHNSFQAEMAGCGQLDSFKNLESLYLDWNHLDNSIIPCIAAIPSLKSLSLAGNNLEGMFPLEEINRLKQLQLLDLSFTEFSGPLPFKELKLENLEQLILLATNTNELSSIEVMTSLNVLSLSLTFINDSTILQGICNLKNLVELDLSWNDFSGEIPHCFRNLTSLRVLDISNNNFSGNIPALVITSLIHLEYLSLSGNDFEGSFAFGSFANHSKLQVFKLAPQSSRQYVDFEGLVLPPPFQLKILNLAGCNLNSKTRQIPNFLFYQKELKLLDLSSMNLVGEIPPWLLENNTRLEVLDLMNNSFTGPYLVDGTPKLHLIRLDISNNEVNGQVPKDFGLFFPVLRYLNLSKNLFEGTIPDTLGNLTAAYSIDLSNNKFTGKVPDRIGSRCIELRTLLLSNNNLQGYFPLRNLTSLEVLYLDGNYFDGNIWNGLPHSPVLQLLDISYNEIQGNLPSWIGNFSSLSSLDLSHNLMEGTIPVDICKLTTLRFLDLSENQLHGSFPSCSSLSYLSFVHLHKNQITGSIPNALLKSSELLTLDLRHNLLSGGIPHNIETLTQLKLLLLGGNNLQGHIPLHLCQLKELTIMDLSQNNFSGRIPSCLGSISFGRAQVANGAFDHRDISDISFDPHGSLDIYRYNSTLNLDQDVDETFLVSDEQEEVEFTTKTRINTYAGNILNYMSGLDLSCNQLTGEIPPELGNLSNMRALNLSNNYLQGSIPSRLSMLSPIESLDLSYNNFSGYIPSELTNLNFLSIFNVSYNNLSGITPDKGQFANFDESNYRGNPNLCGKLLRRHCKSIVADHPVPGVDAKEETDDGSDMIAFIWSFSASFVVVLFTLALSLYVNPQYRRAWFDFIDKWILSIFYRWFRF